MTDAKNCGEHLLSPDEPSIEEMKKELYPTLGEIKSQALATIFDKYILVAWEKLSSSNIIHFCRYSGWQARDGRVMRTDTFVHVTIDQAVIPEFGWPRLGTLATTRLTILSGDDVYAGLAGQGTFPRLREYRPILKTAPFAQWLKDQYIQSWGCFNLEQAPWPAI